MWQYKPGPHPHRYELLFKAFLPTRETWKRDLRDISVFLVGVAAMVVVAIGYAAVF